MSRHIVANGLLIVLTLLFGSVLYPLALLAIGHALFPYQAQGSLLDKNGQATTDESKAVGSRLIGQPFTRDEYFHPRPSAATPAYNGAASGASNFGASNRQLRDRVVQSLAPIVKYSGGPNKGKPLGPDAGSWAHDGFDAWRAEHPRAELEEVPADLVMASSSGLDPDITLAGALYQLDRVAAAWAKTTGRPESELRREIESMLKDHATAPLGGLVGVPLVNVLEMNLALESRFGAALGAR